MFVCINRCTQHYSDIHIGRICDFVDHDHYHRRFRYDNSRYGKALLDQRIC